MDFILIPIKYTKTKIKKISLNITFASILFLNSKLNDYSRKPPQTEIETKMSCAQWNEHLLK